MPTSDSIKLEEKSPMETLLKQRSDLASLPKLGDIVEGAIIEKKGSKVFVDLGPWGSGIIYGREFYEAQDILKNLKEGDAIAAKIVDVDNDEGYIELSMKEAGREKNWRDLHSLMESGETLTIKVAEANRGGLMLEYKGVKGFLPVSQLSSKNYPKVEGGDKEKIYEELKKFVGQELVVKIMDVNQGEEKLIFSEKSQENQELREKISKYHAGDVVEGEVSGIVSFGAFVRFGDGLEGLIHISEMDWRLVENPSSIVKTGEKVKVKIIDIQGEKISLSLKALKENPWEIAAGKYQKGDAIKGIVGK
ncbi:S1 RNA-binding domain-containing protein, partial [Patescibacteria group bacterium]|nr:S1 RNA-binding domain-containing protein [Patescibacteria group bacterium]